MLVFSAFVSAAAMVAPVAAWRRPPGRALFDGLNIAFHQLVFPDRSRARAGALMSGAIARRTGSGPHPKPSRELFCRFSLALLPLGLAMWVAHVLFHLSSAWSTAWPVMQTGCGRPRCWLARYAALDGIEPAFRSGCHARRPSCCCWTQAFFSPFTLAGASLAAIQAVVQDGLLLLAPWATVAAALYAARYLGVSAADANARHGSRVKTTIILVLNVTLAPLVTYADGGGSICVRHPARFS